MIEAELKARLTDPASVRAALGQLSDPEKAIYRDTYYGHDRDLPPGSELRLRTVEKPDIARHLLTFKEPAVDEASGSKPEYETTVGTPAAVMHMLGGLGFVVDIELTKHCENYRLDHDGRSFLATVVGVPELDGTFLEVETITTEEQVGEALRAVRNLLGRLGVGEDELTTELYTDAVRAARKRSSQPG